jgi:hypothetical protein
MEITNDNFKEDGLPKFREACAWADFIALDTEFSGKCILAVQKLELSHVTFYLFVFVSLGTTCIPDDRSHEFDTIEERYQKAKFVV